MKIVDRGIRGIDSAVYELRSRLVTTKGAVDYDVPYVCQFAKPEHAELSLKKQMNAVDDPHWKETGAVSPEQYARWAYTMCGMASAAMALTHITGKEVKPVELAEDALLHGVYTEEDNELSGMRYREFVAWITKYGLSAHTYDRLSVRGIHYALSKGELVMVSVNPNIRGYDTAPLDQKGGHLVLVTGYDRKKNTITINNPSGFLSTNTQKKHMLPLASFNRYYAGRGITLTSALPPLQTR